MPIQTRCPFPYLTGSEEEEEEKPWRRLCAYAFWSDRDPETILEQRKHIREKENPPSYLNLHSYQLDSDLQQIFRRLPSREKAKSRRRIAFIFLWKSSDFRLVKSDRALKSAKCANREEKMLHTQHLCPRTRSRTARARDEIADDAAFLREYFISALFSPLSHLVFFSFLHSFLLFFFSFSLSPIDFSALLVYQCLMVGWRGCTGYLMIPASNIKAEKGAGKYCFKLRKLWGFH